MGCRSPGNDGRAASLKIAKFASYGAARWGVDEGRAGTIATQEGELAADFLQKRPVCQIGADDGGSVDFGQAVDMGDPKAQAFHPFDHQLALTSTPRSPMPRQNPVQLIVAI